MEYIRNEKNVKIAEAICEAIHENAAYLSKIDGAIGDGDHGVNMNKGFLMAKERLHANMSFSESMKTISRTLVMDIGGSMGPIYGTMFSRIARACKQEERSRGYLDAGATSCCIILTTMAHQMCADILEE